MTRLVDALRDVGYVRLSQVAEFDGHVVGHGQHGPADRPFRGSGLQVRWHSQVRQLWNQAKMQNEKGNRG
jgi:hypothetical protein